MSPWRYLIVLFCIVGAVVAPAQQSTQSQSATPQDTTPAPSAGAPAAAEQSPGSSRFDRAVDGAIEREHALIDMLKTHTPLIETYLQDVGVDPQTGVTPTQDHYFLGRLDLEANVDRREYLSQDFRSRLLAGFNRLYNLEYKPLGFSWMIFVDRNDFNRKTYNFDYAHDEFQGDVRCHVFDVTPKKGTGKGRFRGRIWVEDQGYNIVRFNGTFEPSPHNAHFFHMDSWRLNLVQGYWVPAYVYSEEGNFSYGARNKIAFKAQTRLWGYNLHKAAQTGEFTAVLVEPTVRDESPSAQDASPLQAQRNWMQHAADNVIERLQSAGLLAPEGEVDKTLETVINNLLVTNSIEMQPPVHARLMLTSPLESFSVGNTIIVSRGMVDVLPNESSLAAVLAHELAHIMLGHNLSSRYAFNDRMLFSDESTYQNLGFRRSPEEEVAADKKAIELLKNSPYNQNLDAAGLFLREVSARAPALSALLTPHLGNSFTDNKGRVTRMTALMDSAPALDPNKLDQIAALPLGGRVKLNAWDNRAELIKTVPVTIMSARDKMPFEVTPFSPYLRRNDPNAVVTAKEAKTSE